LKTSRSVETGGGISSEHTITDGRIGFAGSIGLKSKRPEDAVVMAGGIVSERKGAERTVERSVPEGRVPVVAEESMVSHSGVADADDIAKECAITDGRVSITFCVADQCSRSSGSIKAAGRIVHKRCCANCGVLHTIAGA